MQDETKMWVTFSRSAKGAKTVRVSVVRGNAAAKWSSVIYGTGLKATVAEAKRRALAVLDEIEEAMG